MYLFYGNWLCSRCDNLPAHDQSLHPLRYPLSTSCLEKKAIKIRWALFACLVLLCLNTNLNQTPVAAALHGCHISPPCTATLPQAKTNSPVLAVIYFGFVCKRTSSLKCGGNKPGELMAGWRDVCLLRELLRLPWRQLYNVVPPNLFRCTAWFMSKYRQTSWSASREFLPSMFWDWVPNFKGAFVEQEDYFHKRMHLLCLFFLD